MVLLNQTKGMLKHWREAAAVAGVLTAVAGWAYGKGIASGNIDQRLTAVEQRLPADEADTARLRGDLEQHKTIDAQGSALLAGQLARIETDVKWIKLELQRQGASANSSSQLGSR